MDPKHVISALAVLYLEDRNGRVRISKDLLTEAYRKVGKLTVTVREDVRNRTQKIVVFLED